jgi:uroporphyrinogen decarboxylase
MSFVINKACWHHYPKELLWELMESHKLLFPGFKRPSADWMPDYSEVQRKDKPYTDVMGCVWATSDDGITGTVVKHPLADWDAYGRDWKIADPNTTDGLVPVDWARKEEVWRQINAAGKSFKGALRHGHTLLQLCDLRGYENLLFDMMDEEPKLDELIDELCEFNLALVNRFIKGGCQSMLYPEDLGMQVGPMIPPDLFRRYIKPSYVKLMKPARDAGIPIHMHSDGDIRTLVDDIVDSGVQIINLQDLVNGIDWIADRFRGKTCVELDVDRQKITHYGTPAEIDALILEEVSKIGSPEGGLCMVYGLYPGVPAENIAALMDAMEKYAFYFS